MNSQIFYAWCVWYNFTIYSKGGGMLGLLIVKMTIFDFCSFILIFHLLIKFVTLINHIIINY